MGSRYYLWSETTVKRILTNEVYIGTLSQGTVQKASYKDKKIIPVAKENWYTVKNHHEPIIDEETFYKVAKMREHRRICASNQTGEKKCHVFAGKLRCKECGHTMIKSGGVRGNKNDWYLRCQLSNKTRQSECTAHNIRYSVIVDLVLKKIQEISSIALENGNIEEIINSVTDSNNKDEYRKRKQELQKLDASIDHVTKSVKVLYSDRVSNIIDDDMFFQLKSEFENELHVLKRKKQEILTSLEQLEYMLKSKSDALEVIRRHTDYSALTHEIVNDFIDYIEIGEKNKVMDYQDIIIHWNF